MQNTLYQKEIEDKTIGLALQYEEVMDDFIILHESYFYTEKNKEIFKAMKDTYGQCKEINMMSLYQYFNKHDLDITTNDLTERQNLAVSPTEFKYCVSQLEEYSQRRTLHKVGLYFTTNSTNTKIDPKKLIEKAAEFMETATVSSNNVYSLSEVIEKRYKAHINQEIKRGVPTGLKDLDNIWAGFSPGETTVLAARPSMGKTAFAQQLALQFDETVLIFSLEMSKESIADRFISGATGINLDDLVRGSVSPSKLKEKEKDLAGIKGKQLLIDDNAKVTTFEAMGQARRIKKKSGLGLIVIDFLTLLSDEKEAGENDHQKVNKITRKVRQIASSLKVPVLVLAQLNRGVEQRADKRPTMSDLRESGGIEEAADNVLLLYLDEYYNKETKKKGVLEVIVGKQKQGPRGGTAEIYYDSTRGLFRNLSVLDQEEPPF